MRPRRSLDHRISSPWRSHGRCTASEAPSAGMLFCPLLMGLPLSSSGSLALSRGAVHSSEPKVSVAENSRECRAARGWGSGAGGSGCRSPGTWRERPARATVAGHFPFPMCCCSFLLFTSVLSAAAKLLCSYSGFSSPRVEWKFAQGDITSLVCYNNKITGELFSFLSDGPGYGGMMGLDSRGELRPGARVPRTSRGLSCHHRRLLSALRLIQPVLPLSW